MDNLEHKSKTFKDYYQNADYKKKHLEYVMTKVECKDCGSMISRCNLTKHKKSVKHMKHEEVTIKQKKEVRSNELNQVHEAFLAFIKIYHEKLQIKTT